MQLFGDFQLDGDNECLWRGDSRVTLTPRPFAVLRYLVENPGRLVTHDELLEALWPETYVQPQVLRTYVLELRKLLGDDPDSPRYIETVPKRGYRFIAAVAQQYQTGGGGKPSLIGRDAELTALRAQFARAQKGDRSTLLLTGETGIGKTALIDAFCAGIRAQRHPARIARGQCIEGFGGKEPFYPVREALASLCSTQSSPEDEKTRALLATALPAWFAHNGATPSLSEICEALETLSRSEPLLLVFEDVHRADPSTLDLIDVLACRRNTAKLMLLASFCRADLDPLHPLRRLEQDLITGECCQQLHVGPLDNRAVCEFVRGRLGVETLPAGLGSLVHQYSTGNPLYIGAILDHLRAQRVLRVDGGAAVLSLPLDEIELGVPDRLAGFIEMQLDSLAEEDRRLLEAGSIAGFIFPAWAAAAALQRERDEVEEACASLARRGRLLSAAGHDELPDGTRSTFYVFTHALYREALYNHIPISRRGHWHQRIADQLRALFAGNESRVAYEIAAHTQAGASSPYFEGKTIRS